MYESQFAIGQIVHHKLFGYRGVIFDVDPVFQGDETWYERVAKTRPPKDRPWYHVLVDGQPGTTYVAERNLAPEFDLSPIRHPFVERFFRGQNGGVYQLRMGGN